MHTSAFFKNIERLLSGYSTFILTAGGIVLQFSFSAYHARHVNVVSKHPCLNIWRRRATMPNQVCFSIRGKFHVLPKINPVRRSKLDSCIVCCNTE